MRTLDATFFRLPLRILSCFFSNEETAQHFLYASATIPSDCKHVTYVDSAKKSIKNRLFFTRFQGLGTPRDSCGLNYHLAPLVGVKPLSPLNNQSFAFSVHVLFAATRVFSTREKFDKSHNGYPVPLLRRFLALRGA